MGNYNRSENQIIGFIAILLMLYSCSRNPTEDNCSQLAGRWKLLKWTSEIGDTGLIYPFGQRPYGLLIYDRNQNVTGLFMAEDREKISEEIPEKRDPEEVRKAFNSFFAFSGKYSVHCDSSFVRHQIEACSNPNWVGRHQVRYFRLEGDSLRLETPPLLVSGTGGAASVQKLLWIRADE